MYYGSIIDAITRKTIGEARDPNLISQQSGQDRREWLTDKEKAIDDWLKQHMGPGFYEGGMDMLRLGGFVSQGEDIGDAHFHSRRMLDADNWPDRISSAMMMSLMVAMSFAPGSQAGIVRGIDRGIDFFRRGTDGKIGRGADEVIDALQRLTDEASVAAYKAIPSGKADDVIDAVRHGADDVLDSAHRFIPDEAGGFGGLRAKDVDLDALARAKMMRASGIGDDDIWFNTDWYYDTDGFWKFEIDDSGFRLQDWAEEQMMATGAVSGKADDIFVHDELFRSYPQLREVGVELQGGPSGHGGFGIFDETGQPVAYGSDAAKRGTRRLYVVAPDADSMTNVAAHELVGHGIPDIEGFAAGGSTEKWVGVERRANPEWDVWDANRELAAEGQAILDSDGFKWEKVQAQRYVDDELGPRLQRQMDEAMASGMPHEELIRLDGEFQREMDDLVLERFPAMRALRRIEEVTPIIEPTRMIPTERAYFEGAGEVSARNVQTRLDFSEEMRQALPPQRTVDVDPAVQTIEFDKAPPTLTQHIPDTHPLSPSQTAFATYERVPGQTTGHLSGSIDADDAARLRYTDDPLGSWTYPERNPLGDQNSRAGRDILYGGNAAPTTEMQGVFQPDPAQPPKFNKGFTARPYVQGFDEEADLVNQILRQAEIDRLTGTETVRGYFDAQDMSTVHKPILDPAPGDANAMWLQGTSQRPLTMDELIDTRAIGAEYGLPDTVDTGVGATVTDFAGDPTVDARTALGITKDVDELTAFVTAEPAQVVGGFTDFSDAWKAGEGSGEATRLMLAEVDKMPANVVTVLDNNPDIPRVALELMQRDANWMAEWGVTRADIQNARRITGEGIGWIGRLREALENGAILPAVALPLLGLISQPQQPYPAETG